MSFVDERVMQNSIKKVSAKFWKVAPVMIEQRNY
jgi:hypothetical protein